MAELKKTAFSPATVGNVASGFDLIGHCVEGLGDRVTAMAVPRAGHKPLVQIDSITGVVTDLPKEPMFNTASRAVAALLDVTCPDFDVVLMIDKGIPLGSGLGGSAASATAALVAVNALLDDPFIQADLYPFALIGESIASADAVGDNVGPQLMGGLVLATTDELIKLPVPVGLTAVVIHPNITIETTQARQCLQQPFDLQAITAQQTALSHLLLGLNRSHWPWIKKGLIDSLIEPRRKHMIPGFDNIKNVARSHGALGASISGAGPSIFAWFSSLSEAKQAAPMMQSVFAEQGIQARAIVSTVNAPGARLI